MSELPEGWAIVPLGDISEVKGGKRLPKGAKFADEVTNHPYIRVSDFRGRTVSLDNIQYLSEDVYQHVSNYTINSKDIYISIAGTIGVIGTIPEGLDGANLTENAAKITNINFLEQRFLLYFLNSGAAQAHFHEQTVSTSQPKLALFRIKTLEIPLAPLAEQKRIADKLDALLARVDGCRALLTRVPAILKRFRQAVLAAATSGALTADWREGQNELRRQNRYLVADSNCEVTNFEDRYKSVRLGTLVQEPMRNGKSVRDGNGHLVLRLSSLKKGTLDWNEVKHGDWGDIDINRFLICTGDFLIARGNGSRDLVGRGALVTDVPAQVAFPDTMIRVRPDKSVMVPHYLRLVWDAAEVRNQIELAARTTAGIWKIAQSDLEMIEVPLPPVSEQHEIVRRVETLFGYADRLEARYTAALTRVERLTPALLAKAFRGELVAQDPADEPAAVLLARVQAARGAVGESRARRRPGID